MTSFRRIAILGALALVAIAALAPIGSAASLTKTVDVKVGKKSAFLVKTNPSTGYSWKWTSAPDEMIATGSEPKVLPKASGMVGAPQKARITITGKGKGTTSGELSYVAPDGTTVAKKMIVKITVS